MHHNIGLFTSEETTLLNERGVSMKNIENFSRTIVFLSNQSQLFSTAVLNFLVQEFQQCKCDLRNSGYISYSALSAVFATILNIGHPIFRLDISYLNIMSDIGTLVYLLCANKKVSLHEVQLSGNKLAYEGFSKLYKALSDSNGLRTIAIADCALDFESYSLLQSTINNDISTLRVLSIAGNSVGDKGIYMLLQTLGQSNSIKYLNISATICTDKSIEGLGKFLLTNRSLECLEFEENL